MNVFHLFLAAIMLAFGWHVGSAIVYNALAQWNGWLHRRRARRAQTMLTEQASDPDNKNVVHLHGVPAPGEPVDPRYL